MRGMGNQLEAERIISRREIENLRRAPGAQAALRVALLAPPGTASARDGAPAVGALAWNPVDGRGILRISGLAGQAPDRDYQLWLDGAGARLPASCAVFHSDAGAGGAEIHVDSAAGNAAQFLLIDGTRGGSRTLEEAKAGGSIVLATPPAAGRISN